MSTELRSRVVAAVPFARRAFATLAALTAAVIWRSWGDTSLPQALWIPAVLCVVSAALVHRPHLGAQMLARAVWWGSLVIGSLIAMSSSASEAWYGSALAISMGLALVVLGRQGLEGDAEPGAFAPKAFRGSLILAMVMAMADTQSLLLFGGLMLEADGEISLALGCGVVMVIALVGLYRLKTWGLLLNLAANIAIAALGIAGVLDLPDPVVFALVITAVVQAVLPLPLLRAAAFGRDVTPSGSTLHRGGLLVSSFIVVVLMGLSTFCVTTGIRLLDF